MVSFPRLLLSVSKAWKHPGWGGAGGENYSHSIPHSAVAPASLHPLADWFSQQERMGGMFSSAGSVLALNRSPT